MKIQKLLFIALAFASSAAFAAVDLKAISCMYEIKAEALRFARLRQEIAVAQSNPVQQKKLKTQLKASVQELMLNLQESKPGLTKFGLQSQYQRMDSAISDYLSESALGGDKNTPGLRDKQNAVISLSDEMSQQLVQKVASTAANDVALIGSAKVNIEKLAYDFEVCTDKCAQQLPADVALIEKNVEGMHTSLAKYFKKSSYDLASNQLFFLKKAVNSKLNNDSNENTLTNLIVTTGYMWQIVDEVLDAYVEKTGE
jgi:hypothetical protein